MTKYEVENNLPCGECGGNRFNKNNKCMNCRNTANREYYQHTREDQLTNPKDEICENCGNNDWDWQKQCKNCRKLKQQENLLKDDRPCPRCNKTCGIGKDYCDGCSATKQGVYIARDDRLCGGVDGKSCTNMCVINQNRCRSCGNEQQRLYRLKDDRPCNGIDGDGCDNMCKVGYGGCEICYTIMRHRYLLRDDRECSRCGNYYESMSIYCKTCDAELNRKNKERADRICPGVNGADCGNFCFKTHGYCRQCSIDRLLVPFRKCEGYHGVDCDNFAMDGNSYCKLCSVTRSNAYRTRKHNAEGEHDSQELEMLYELFNNTCLACLLEVEFEHTDEIHADHIQSLFNGGSNGVYNLQPLCKYHNSSKRSKNIRYIEEGLTILDIPIEDYLDVTGLSQDEYQYVLDWWDNLDINENKRFQW